VIHYNMFYVPIVIIQCENWNEKRKKLNDIFALHEKYCILDNGDDCATDYFSSIENPKLEYTNEISLIFHEEIMMFKNKFDIDNSFELDLTSAWFEVSNYGDCHSSHTHGNSGYSAVCYIDYDSKAHTPTFFTAPFKNFLNGASIDHAPPNIQEGSLIFFHHQYIIIRNLIEVKYQEKFYPLI